MEGDGTHYSAMCWHRRCLGRVDVTCDKFSNRLYVLKTGYRFETGNRPVNRLSGYRYSKFNSDVIIHRLYRL